MRLKRLLTETDLVPGLAGILALVVGVLWLPWPTGALGGALLGLVLYLGARFVLMRSAGDDDLEARQARTSAVARARAEALQIRQLVTQAPTVGLSQQIEAVSVAMEEILRVIEVDGRDARLARDFLAVYILPARKLLATCLPLAARGVATAQAQLATIETDDLPHLSSALADYYDRLHRDALIDVEVAREMLPVNLGGAGSATSTPPVAAAMRPIPAVRSVEPPITTPVPPASVPPAGLTRREVEVLCLIANGRSNGEIASELFLSERTVERHITNLYGKIDARGRADATAFAFRHRLCDDARRPPMTGSQPDH